MRALHEAGLDQADERGVQGLRGFEVAARRRAGLLAVDDLQIRAAAEALHGRGFHRVAEQDDGVAFVLEPLRGDVLGLLDEADDSDGGRRVNRAERAALVVERDVAAGDGRVEGAATFGNAAHGFLELPENLRVMRVAEVEVVGRAERRSTGAGEVAARLGDGGFPAFVGVEIDVGPVAVAGEGDEFVGKLRVES